MPVYEYRCRSCGHEFEITQAMTDDALTTCPECGGELRKVFSPVGIAFKGSGFYKNDSGSRSGSTKRGAGDGGSGGDASKSDSSKGDSSKGDSSKGDASKSGGGSGGNGAKGTSGAASGS